MTKALKIVIAAASLVVLAASVASAGLNSGAAGHLYWMNGNTKLAARDFAALTPANMLVTVTNVTNIRGADIQILYNTLNGGPIPDAWAMWSGGCNDGGAVLTADPAAGSLLPKLLVGKSGETAVSGVATSQNGISYATGDCRTPHGVALLWLSEAGANGGNRASTNEYAVWRLVFDTQFAGGSGACYGDQGEVGICFNPNERIPCTDVQRGAVATLLDGNLGIDYVPFAPGNAYLTWFGGQLVGNCPYVTPTPKSSWGSLKRLYK